MEHKGVSSHASLPPNLAFQKVSLVPLPHPILQQVGGNCGRCKPLPWSHLHLIQCKELPGPLMSPGPVAFSALWAVRQEAGGFGGREAASPLFCSPLLSKYRLSELWDTPPPTGEGASQAFITGYLERPRFPDKGTDELPLYLNSAESC